MRVFSAIAVSAAVLCLVSGSSWAYPIFYKCDGNRRMTEVLTGTEIQQKLRAILALSPSRQNAELDELCAGVGECEQQLRQVLDVAQVSAATAEKMFEQELKRLYAADPNEPLQPLDENSFSTREKIESAAFQVSACRNTIEDLPDSAFVNGGRTFIYYPHYNEYTYVTGCANKGQWQCQPVFNGNLDDAIRRALVAGADPYFALAIGMMEEGPQGVDALYLDPIGQYGVMGCQSKESDSGALYSFGNRHEIEPGVVHNPVLSEHLAAAIDAASGTGSKSNSGKSYFCRDLSSGTGQIEESAGAKQCCIGLPIDFSNATGNESTLENALVMEYVRQTQNSQLPGEKDPAYRLQHFNGFSHLMGGAEGVPVFRSGVDNYKNPNYGDQGMDYILNSLISNPYIRARVDQISKETHAQYQSVLCQDVKVPGVYQVDSDVYFKKNRDSARLSSLNGRPWTSLTHREKQVLLSELRYPKVTKELQSKFPNLPQELQPFTGSQIAGVVFKYSDGSGYVLPQGGSAQPFGDPKAPPPNMTPYGSSIPLDPAQAKEQVVLKDPYGGSEKISVTSGSYPITSSNPIQDLMAQQIPMTVSYQDGKYEVKYEKDASGVFSQHAVTGSGSNMGFPIVITLATGAKIRIDQSCDTQLAKFYASKHLASYAVPPPGITICQMLGGSSLQRTQTVVYQDGEKMTVAQGDFTPADLNRLEGRTQASPAKTASIQEILDYYYKKILPTRNTIGKASSFAPWGDLNDEQMEIIRNNFEGEPIMQGVDPTKIANSPPTPSPTP